jgi:adenylate cyclase
VCRLVGAGAVAIERPVVRLNLHGRTGTGSRDPSHEPPPYAIFRSPTGASPSSGSMIWRDLFGELRRRRVYRVSAAYVIIAFALLQGADIVLPALGAPGWTLRLVVVLAIVGLPIAATLAWVFEITPRGIERTEPRGGRDGREPSPVSGRMAVAGVAGVVVGALLVGGAAWWATRGVSGAVTPDLANSGGPDRGASVAVLPCIDVSAARDHEYFGDGITEEIIGELARFEGLKVISRTSVVALKGSRLTLPQIADTLGVRHVLECSFQRSGSRVRVRATLIDPRDDAQVWADAFDRELSDVVSMQEDIARHVGRALLARVPELRPRGAAAHAPDAAAYDAYLRGTAARRQLNRQSLLVAIGAFEQAIAADPAFEPAYSGLSQVHTLWTLFGYPGDPEPYTRVALALDLAERAIALDSASADAYAARAHAGLRAWRPADAVLADLDRAARLAPSSGEIRNLRAVGLAFAGRFDEAVAEMDAVIALDPLAPGHHDFRAMSLVLARRYDDALRSARLARSLAPTFLNPLRQETRALILLGRFDECARLDPGPYVAFQAMCLHSLGRGGEARAIIEGQAAAVARAATEGPLTPGGLAADIAEYHAWIGDPAGTIEWLRRSIDFSPTGQFLVPDTGTYDRIRDDPTFQAGFERLRRDIQARVERTRAGAGA